MQFLDCGRLSRFKSLTEACGVKSPVVRELRAVQRFTVNLPVHLSWPSAGWPDQQVRGFTRDISTRGMFVLVRTGPRRGRSAGI